MALWDNCPRCGNMKQATEKTCSHCGMIKIDVVVLTKNSDKHLNECLSSIYRAIPVKHLIIVDGFSKDRTLEIARKYKNKYGKVIIIHTDFKRGKAREIGIRFVFSKWFAFVDSDVVLNPNWFIEVSSHIAEKVGAVGSTLPLVRIRTKEHEDIELAMQSLKRCFLRPRNIQRKGTISNLLIRTKLVKNIHIPKFIHAGEERVIMGVILKKGYRTVHVDKVLCNHYPKPRGLKFKDVGAHYRFFKLRSIYDLLFNLIKTPFKGLFVTYKSKNPKVIVFMLRMDLSILYGWLKWKKVFRL